LEMGLWEKGAWFSGNMKMLTLTFASTVRDVSIVLECVKAMCRRYQKRTGDSLRYIATMEWQKKRKCLHVHLLTDAVYIENEVWAKDLWRVGFTSVSAISSKGSPSACLNAVAYVLKYIEKDVTSHGDYSHVYFRSRKWNMEVEKDYGVCHDDSLFYAYANDLFGAAQYVSQKFCFETWDGEVITIIDVFGFS